MAKPSYAELVGAVVGAAIQYMECDGFLDHQALSAGENIIDCLDRLGLIVWEVPPDLKLTKCPRLKHPDCLEWEKIQAISDTSDADNPD